MESSDGGDHSPHTTSSGHAALEGHGGISRAGEAMNVTVGGYTYTVTNEADVICLVVALSTLDALAQRKAA